MILNLNWLIECLQETSFALYEVDEQCFLSDASFSLEDWLQFVRLKMEDDPQAATIYAFACMMVASNSSDLKKQELPVKLSLGSTDLAVRYITMNSYSITKDGNLCFLLSVSC